MTATGLHAASRPAGMSDHATAIAAQAIGANRFALRTGRC